jgi:hypothetical protein
MSFFLKESTKAFTLLGTCELEKAYIVTIRDMMNAIGRKSQRAM